VDVGLIIDVIDNMQTRGSMMREFILELTHPSYKSRTDNIIGVVGHNGINMFPCISSYEELGRSKVCGSRCSFEIRCWKKTPS
jgi:hypothetical protein